MTKADRGRARPKAHGTAAVIYNLQISRAPGFMGLQYMHVSQNGSVCLQQKPKQTNTPLH